MSTNEITAEELIARAKADVEASEQIAYWSRRLQEAHEARRSLLDFPPAAIKAALEQR